MKKDLSIILPCYNEEMIIEESLKEIVSVMDTTNLDYEIIFVDDMSSDRTRDIIKNLCEENRKFRYIFHKENKGRGAAVNTGIKESLGEVVGFIDIDLSTPAIFIPLCYLKVKEGYDIVTALRIYKILELKRLFYNLLRLLMHIGYRILLNILLNTELKDTETGCKFFRREKVIDLMEEVVSTHWFWDTEIMTRAYLKGYKILEIPTLYLRKPEHGSRVKIVKDTIYYLKKLFWFYREIRKK